MCKKRNNVPLLQIYARLNERTRFSVLFVCCAYALSRSLRPKAFLRLFPIGPTSASLKSTCRLTGEGWIGEGKVEKDGQEGERKNLILDPPAPERVYNAL